MKRIFTVLWTIEKDDATERYLVTPDPSQSEEFSAGWRFRKERHPATPPYLVRRRLDGSWTCTCRGWERWHQCKHVQTMQTFIQTCVEVT